MKRLGAVGVTKVRYREEDWRLLKELRSRALKVIKPLVRACLDPVVYGSVARGDVSFSSDVDVALLHPVAPCVVEEALRREGLEITGKEVVQATPQHAPKAYLYVLAGGEVIVSFPLVKLSEAEVNFYTFGGKIGVEGLLEGRRVSGVNKSLKVIIPVSDGHLEFPLLGNELETSKVTGIPISIIEERKRMLLRRRTCRRSGVFVRMVLGPDEPIEVAVRELATRSPLKRVE